MAARILMWAILGGSVLLGIVSFIEDRGRELSTDNAERAAEDAQALADAGAEDPELVVDIDEQGASEELARVQYMESLQALDGLPARLRLFGAASELLAQQCRRDAVPGWAAARLAGGHGLVAFELPGELKYLAARPGDPTDWQPRDRALKRLEAICDQDDAALHADAHERVWLAAAELAGRLDDTALPIDLDHCWFCERQIPDVPRLLCSPHASICDECVRACHDKLEYEQ